MSDIDPHDADRMRHFLSMATHEREAAVRLMWNGGYSAYQIAAATGLSIEAVLAIVEPPRVTA